MKRYFALFLTLALCLTLFACGKQPVQTPTEPATQPPTEAPTVAPTAPPATQPVTEPPTEAPTQPEVPEVPTPVTMFTFTDDKQNPVLTLTASLPACENLPQIDAYYKAIYDDLYAVCSLNAQDAASRRSEFVDAGLEFNPWAVEVEGVITRNDGVTLSVLREIYENFGGAHPLITYQAETFDTATQGRLVLGNLFTVSEDDYLARLRQMILAQMDQKESESGVLYYAYAREQLMSLLDPMDFALTEDCLLIFFNEYALAPHAAGLQHFYLPLEQLSDILNPQYLVK